MPADSKNLEVILNCIAQGVVMFDDSRRLTIWNKQFEQNMQFPDGFLKVGMPHMDLLMHFAVAGIFGEGDPVEISRDRLDLIWGGAQTRIDVALRTGETYEMLCQPTPEGALVISYTDITLHIEAENSSARDQELTDQIFLATPVPLAVVRRSDASYLKINAASLELFGLTEAEMKSKHSSELYAEQNDRQRLLAELDKSGYVRGMEVRLRNFHTDEVRECLMSMLPAKLAGEDSYVVAALDISKRKLAEEDLRKAMKEIDKANQNLEQKVIARTRELQAAKNEAEAARHEAENASQTKSEFLANMSHEFRTPLNAIIGFSALIKGALLGPLDDKYQEYAGDINTAGEHLLEIVSDILDISKVEAGVLDIMEEEVDLTEITTSCGKLVRGRVDEAGVTLVFDMAADLPLIRVDSLRLTQILMNLVSNALKFTPQGGRITVTGNINHADCVALAVSDTGIGIAEEDIPKVLEKFGQVRSGHMHAHEGAGLGLALSKSLMEQHNGTLEIKSEVGKGTTVTATFPQERSNELPPRRAKR
ncbi:MAG: PAS domain S-box protein [Alphaproteobacteria bacterium]|jgi:PAS domain S-box-containing protein|nr:PAS domain S-box protein [Alphaproteobacteria bacterium]MBT4083827.1 PAS domain S-box protein [Alphaproteobacteria bacterium]MBT4542869.1 PAS domain S-box protein [Alphaproteobacteria bacterium]MBT7744245.1 PAS domain S-box protein [Alphaproteobacteria bacterium]